MVRDRSVQFDPARPLAAYLGMVSETDLFQSLGTSKARAWGGAQLAQPLHVYWCGAGFDLSRLHVRVVLGFACSKQSLVCGMCLRSANVFGICVLLRQRACRSVVTCGLGVKDQAVMWLCKFVEANGATKAIMGA